MGWMRDRLEDRLRQFFDLLMIIVFDLAVFSCALLAFWFAVFLTGRLFPEETTVVRIAKMVSGISIITGYAFYTVFDLFRYLRGLARKEREFPASEQRAQDVSAPEAESKEKSKEEREVAASEQSAQDANAIEDQSNEESKGERS